MRFVKMASVKDLKLNEMMKTEVEGKDICLVNVEGKYYAIGDRCTHMSCSLSRGTLKGENVTCPCHGSTFNVKTGTVVNGPAKKPEPIFQIKVEEGQVLVNV